jgi:CheY-like chemotaxis protein
VKARSILLIDDNDIDKYITKNVLLRNHITENVVTLSSAEEGLSFLSNTKLSVENIPQYIFLDICMPEMDGFDFLDEFVKLPEFIKSLCSIFMLTSSIDNKDLERAKKYSCVDQFLRKPLDINILNAL